MLSMFPSLTRLIDAARVIELRIRMMALGRSSPDELLLMITEKAGAIEVAAAIMMRCGSSALLIDSYQKIAAATVARLSVTNQSANGPPAAASPNFNGRAN